MMIFAFWGFVLGFFFSNGGCLHLKPDSINTQLLPSYDYIIVGGGIAGLVVANRLSEGPNVTVLVLESGELDDSDEGITIPALIGQRMSTKYDWNFTTTAQTNLDGNTRELNSGRVVGGSSILNGLVWTRGSVADYDAWEALGNRGWGWNDLLPYFMKSETYNPNLETRDNDDLHVPLGMLTHGSHGPVQLAYPNFIYNQSKNFLQGATELGVQILNDLNSGVATGAAFAPSSMDPHNQSRCDARTAYVDRTIDRPNLHLATQQTVTRILLEKGNVTSPVAPYDPLRRALGVEVSSTSQGINWTISCSKEIILAAGAIISPVLLQVSGIGPASLLQSINVTAQVDLPGVGQNFQDHGMVDAFYEYRNSSLFTARNLTGDVLQHAEDLYHSTRTGPWTAPLISTVVFPPIKLLTSNSSFLFNQIIPVVNLPEASFQQRTVTAGYTAQHKLLSALLGRSHTYATEIMADSIGTLSVAAMRPFSRGTIRALNRDILSSVNVNSVQDRNIHANIAIDPAYCSQPVDCSILVEALRFNARLVNTTSMRLLQPSPTRPWAGPGNETAEEEQARLLGAVKMNLRTEFHPAGTTAMMPLSLGGVVNTKLLVYGTTNLRVIDAGIMPLIPGAHLQAAVYAVAEKAADIIKMANRNGFVRCTRPTGDANSAGVYRHVAGRVELMGKL